MPWKFYWVGWRKCYRWAAILLRLAAVFNKSHAFHISAELVRKDTHYFSLLQCLFCLWSHRKQCLTKCYFKNFYLSKYLFNFRSLEFTTWLTVIRRVFVFEYYLKSKLNISYYSNHCCYWFLYCWIDHIVAIILVCVLSIILDYFWRNIHNLVMFLQNSYH